jgi:flagellar M-ring protein FliF
MDNALVPAPAGALRPAAPMPVASGFAERLVALPARSKVGLVVGLMALVAIVMAMTMWSSKGDYRVLYANLSDKDGGAIIAQLSQLNVPYKHADGGAAILVPADKVHDVRLKLAAAGLPKGGTVGFELTETQRFGITQFQERLNFQRGLEGELVRSITSLAAVAGARVHLALPNQNGFFREQQKPSASVLVTLHPGRTLDNSQIAGIVHLVASSVPEMSTKAVSIVDQNGALLSASGETPQNGLDAQQLQYVRQLESTYVKRIVELLEPVVGRDNLRATVTADVDFSQTEATSEEFRPNQGANAAVAIRSQQSSEMQGSAPGAPAGVPGAASNQPPVPATAPINGAAAALQGPGGTGASNSRRDSVTNFEVDKTVRVTRAATGTIRRLNAAVVVNHRSQTDPKGKTTLVELPAEEVQKLTTLVKQSVGFKEDRGDSVQVINAPFRVEKIDAVDLPLWKRPEAVDLLRSLAVPGALAIVALAVVFGLVRPALKSAMTPPPPAPDAAGAARPGGTLDAVVADNVALPGPGGLPALEAPTVDARLESARQLARDNPAAVAGILRGWVSGEAA